MGGSIDNWLRDDFAHWVATPGAMASRGTRPTAGGLFHVDDRKGIIALGYRERLNPYKGAWHLLER
jgi:hypothetical protein